MHLGRPRCNALFAVELDDLEAQTWLSILARYGASDFRQGWATLLGGFGETPDEETVDDRRRLGESDQFDRHLVFLLAAALAGVTGYRWVRASEGHREDDDCEGNAVWIDESTILD